MRLVLVGLGVALCAAGAIGLVFGLELSDIERGQTQAVVGSVVLAGGILTLALSAVLGTLERIAAILTEMDQFNHTDNAKAFDPASAQSDLGGSLALARHDDPAPAEPVREAAPRPADVPPSPIVPAAPPVPSDAALAGDTDEWSLPNAETAAPAMPPVTRLEPLRPIPRPPRPEPAPAQAAAPPQLPQTTAASQSFAADEIAAAAIAAAISFPSADEKPAARPPDPVRPRLQAPARPEPAPPVADQPDPPAAEAAQPERSAAPSGALRRIWPGTRFGRPAPEAAAPDLEAMTADLLKGEKQAEELGFPAPIEPARPAAPAAPSAPAPEATGAEPLAPVQPQPEASPAAAKPVERTAAESKPVQEKPADARKPDPKVAELRPALRTASEPGRFPLRSMTLPRGPWPEAPTPPAPPPSDTPPAADVPKGHDWFERALAGYDEPPLPDLKWGATSPESGAAHEASATTAHHEAHAASEPADPSRPEPEVVGRHESNGATYIMYSDGSIDAETEAGVWRFASLTELKDYIESAGEQS